MKEKAGRLVLTMDNKTLEKWIQEIYESLETNNFATLGRAKEPLWGKPLVGVADGEDPYYQFLKTLIGPFHWSPKEVFDIKYPGLEPENLRVVSMIFPQTKNTKETQGLETLCPSREWIVSRGEWEPMMEEFSGKLVKRLEDIGIKSVSIDLVKEFKAFYDPKAGWASNWSHRHSAYLAGLGTFGLSDGLITEVGKAVRITSLIVDAPLEVSKMPYDNHHQWCLYYHDGSCKACINRCPTDAISLEGHDKNLCADYEDYFLEHYWPEDIDRGDYKIGCGLCQVKIPCESRRPKGTIRKD